MEHRDTSPSLSKQLLPRLRTLEITAHLSPQAGPWGSHSSCLTAQGNDALALTGLLSLTCRHPSLLQAFSRQPCEMILNISCHDTECEVWKANAPLVTHVEPSAVVQAALKQLFFIQILYRIQIWSPVISSVC